MTVVREPAAGPATAPDLRVRATPGGIGRAVAVRIGSTFGWMLLALVAMAMLWQGAVAAFRLDAFGTKSPSDVWEYLFTAPAAAQSRATLATALSTTAEHALVGFASGALLGTGLSIVFVVVPWLRRPLLPLILLTQALPILAILPLFILLFGRGLTVTIVITTLAVFFPMFVLMSQGLTAIGGAGLDVFRSLDAGTWRTLIHLRLPHAVPNFFAAARICVPSAMFGAIVSEWLATGDGLGYLMITAAASIGGYGELWSAVAITTVFTMVWYAVIGVLEALFLGHFAPSRLAGA